MIKSCRLSYHVKLGHLLNPTWSWDRKRLWICSQKLTWVFFCPVLFFSQICSNGLKSIWSFLNTCSWSPWGFYSRFPSDLPKTHHWLELLVMSWYFIWGYLHLTPIHPGVVLQATTTLSRIRLLLNRNEWVIPNLGIWDLAEMVKFPKAQLCFNYLIIYFWGCLLLALRLCFT